MAATMKAGPPPRKATINPASGGPAVKARLRASSSRVLAAPKSARSTSPGTRAGAATEYTTVPVAVSAPISASKGSDNSPAQSSTGNVSSAAARSSSADAISRRRRIRSASTPAGSDSSRNGRLWAVESMPVSAGPAPSTRTARMGAAANAICSAHCADRFDQARRWKAAGNGTMRLSGT